MLDHRRGCTLQAPSGEPTLEAPVLSLPDWINARIRVKMRGFARGEAAALARAVGRSPSHISGIAAGANNFDPAHWPAVAAFCGEALADWIHAAAQNLPPDQALSARVPPDHATTTVPHKAGGGLGSHRPVPLSDAEHQTARARALIGAVSELALTVGALLQDALDHHTEDASTAALRRLLRADRRTLRRRTTGKARKP